MCLHEVNFLIALVVDSAKVVLLFVLVDDYAFLIPDGALLATSPGKMYILINRWSFFFQFPGKR